MCVNLVLDLSDTKNDVGTVCPTLSNLHGLTCCFYVPIADQRNLLHHSDPNSALLCFAKKISNLII